METKKEIGKTVFYKNGKTEFVANGETWEQECDLDWEKTLDGDHRPQVVPMREGVCTDPIRKMKFPESSLVHSLEYDGEILTVTYVKNASKYTFPMDYDTAISIYTAPSVGKALLSITKAKEIKGTKVEQED